MARRITLPPLFLIAGHLSALLLILALTYPSAAQQHSRTSGSAHKADDSALVDVEGLGALSFPNSGAPEAQDAFLRGVLLLHSFEYGQAAEAFREAQVIDPEFGMAYWGEAMTYNHPLWRNHDRAAGREVLERLAPTAAERSAKVATERETLYLDAVETLFTFEGPKQERDRAYMEAMRRLHEAYPDDDEARAFYGLSILGTADGARDFATYMRGAATVLPVFERNPRHPGAAHYIIHAFDDPIHAPLGLPAANAYADIAPDAAHAQHMTSHIFVALGMWEPTVTANIRARDTQDAELERRGVDPNVCGHYSSWLHYAYLQLGRTEEAEDLMDSCHERVQEEASVGEWDYFASMRARHVVDTENWLLAKRWSVVPDRVPDEDGDWGYGSPSLKYRITDAVAGLYLGDDTAARVLVEGPRPEAPGTAFQIDQVAGLVAIREGKVDEGLSLLRRAAETEGELPFEYGPPEPVQPGYELLGKELLELGRGEEAEAAFRRAVERTPGRLRAVRGLAEVQ